MTRLLVLTCLWKRPRVAARCFACLQELAANAPDFELTVLAVGSEGEASRALCERYGVEYLEHANQPLGAKWNAGLRAAAGYDPDYVLVLGSDDLASPDLLDAYRPFITAGVDYVGATDLHLYHAATGRLGYFGGYGRGRRGEPLGAGRLLSRSTLARAGWRLWRGDLRRGLDGSMTRRLRALGVRGETFRLRDAGVWLVDLKTDVNIWRFDQFRTRPVVVSAAVRSMLDGHGRLDPSHAELTPPAPRTARPSPTRRTPTLRRDLPFVSAQCITYGRNQCLEEAIQFFLDQDYAGQKQLVIVNDLPEQRLVFDHPEVKVINLPRRCPTIGAKRNLAVSECDGDVLVCWDDDDGYLPAHLRACVGYLDGYDYARPDKCLVWTGEATIERVAGCFVAQHVFTRKAFIRAGAYPTINSGQDMELDSRLRRTARCNWPSIAPHEITYLFRWANGQYHLSGFGRDRADRRTGYERIGEAVARGVVRGTVPTGRVQLEPGHHHDYGAMVASYLNTLSQPAHEASGSTSRSSR